MSDPAAILADASAHGASMSHVRGLYALVPTGPVVAESLYLATVEINRDLQDEIDRLRSKVEETLRERERANEWLSLLIDLRNAATWTGNGTAPAEDLAAVLVIGETGGVRDILNAIDRGMADPTPALHDTRAGYPPEWAGVVRTYNRAQRRSMARLAGVMSGRTGAPVAECERWLHEAGGDVCRAIGMMRRAAR